MPAEPHFDPPDPREVDPRVVRRAFSRAAATYDSAAVLQREIGSRMTQRLDYVKLTPQAVLDAGCGTGEAVGELTARYPAARIIALDAAVPMLSIATARVTSGRSLFRRLLRSMAARTRGPEPSFVCGDIVALPLRGVSLDLVWSNLTLQWINARDLPRVFAEFRRVLKVGGLLSFTTFGPDTLKELRSAFVRADAHTHVNRFVDMHDLGDMLGAAGFADPVMDMEYVTLTYAEPRALLNELKLLGATNATRGRPRGLMGKGRFERMLAALEALRQEGRIPATFEVVYGHAWKGQPRRTPEGDPIVHIERRPRGEAPPR